MATGTLTNASVKWNSVDLSDHCFQVTINYEAETVDDTAFSTNATRSFAAGLKNWSMDLTFYADEAASKVNQTMFPDVGGTARTVTIKPAATATATNNPAYTGTALLTTFQPLGGTVGEMNTAVARVVAASGSALSRSTS